MADIEELLGRELRQVADGVHVPAMPPLPQEPPRAHRHWAPALVAAAVVLIVAGAVVLALALRGDRQLEPSPPLPSRTATADAVPKTPPTIPYVLDQRLYVDGERVPGTWWSVEAGDAGWVALRTDYTWWWGRGPQANAVNGLADSPLVISPNGEYAAGIDDHDRVTGFETRFGGEGLGAVPVDLGDPQSGNPVRVRAVTNDGRVIVQGAETAVLWLPLVDNSTVDLTDTAPGQVVESNTPAGLVVTEGEDGAPYLAEISDAGEPTPTGTVPAHDSLAVSPGGARLAWTTPGTLGGEVTSLTTLQAGTVDGTEQVTLTAPDGWGFRVEAWAWEDDDHLVSPVVSERGDRPERVTRCDVHSARCVLIDAP